MSRLAAAALRRAATASGVSSSPSSRSAAFAPASSRLFSTDASGEAAGAAAGSQDDSFLKSSGEGSSRVLVSATFFYSGVSSLFCSFVRSFVGRFRV